MVKNQDGGDQLQHFQHFTNCQILNKHHRARELRDSPFKRGETREFQREVRYITGYGANVFCIVSSLHSHQGSVWLLPLAPF